MCQFHILNYNLIKARANFFLVVIDDATTISVIIITITICVQTIEKISKSFESNICTERKVSG